MLDAPMFQIRWRWNASTALAVPRRRNGQRVPPILQRMQAEDLVAVVFPDQLACLENISGGRDVPDHPLVNQTVHDCLYEAMDIEELEQLLTEIKSGAIELVTRDLREPSPLAESLLTARPYAFLDDAPLEERRTHAVRNRRWIDPQEAAEFGRLWLCIRRGQPTAVQRPFGNNDRWWNGVEPPQKALLIRLRW